MRFRTITVLDREPIVGGRGQILVTSALSLPPEFVMKEWLVSGEDLLGSSAIRTTLQASREPTCWAAVAELELRNDLDYCSVIDAPDPRFVRAHVEILSDEIPGAEWVEAPARLLLTVQVSGTQDE